MGNARAMLVCCTSREPDSDHCKSPPMTPRHMKLMSLYAAKLDDFASDKGGSVPSEEEMKEALEPLVAGFFDFHDAEGTGILDEGKSKMLFSSLVEHGSSFMKASTHSCCIRAKHAVTDKQQRKHISRVLKRAVQLGNEMHREEFPKKQEKREEAAFAVLDPNGDGRIEKKDLLQALVPGTEMHDKLFQALGFRNIDNMHEVKMIFLKQYVKTLGKFLTYCSSNMLDVDPRQIIERVVQDLFGAYDKNGNDYLEPSEAEEFFKDLTSFKEFKSLLHHSQRIRALSEVNVENLLHSQERYLERTINNQYDLYTNDKDTCHSEAFAVIDVDQNGILQFAEVKAALTPGRSRNDQFLEALYHERIYIEDF